MRRVNIDGSRFMDLDEFMIMEVVPIRFEAEEGVLKSGFKVDAITKIGSRVESLFIDKISGSDKLCYKWISDNWVNAKK